MRKVIVGLLMFLMLPMMAQALTHEEALGHLKSISFPLYGKEIEQGRQCVGWNALASQSGEIAFYISAGHCENSYYHVGDRGELLNFPLLAKVNDDGRYEFLYTIKPVCNKATQAYLSLSVKIDQTKSFFTLAQTSGTERFEKVGVVELRYLRDDPKLGLVFDMVCPAGGCKQLPSKGLSGSPIIDEDLNVVALMKGAHPMEPDHPLGTELAPILPFLKSVASTNSRINHSRYCTGPSQ